MKKIIATGSFAFLAGLLSACANTDRVPEATEMPHAGEAVRSNIAVQLVNPAAPSAGDASAMNGDRAAIAQERYAQDRVKQPPRISDTGNPNSGGNAGAGGGGGGVSGGAAGNP